MVRAEFNSRIFKGVAVEFNDGKNIDEMAFQLTGNRQVKQVWPIRSYPLLSDDMVTLIDTDADDFSTIAKRQASGDSTDTFSTHVQTQVNKLTDAGIRGEGVRIGIIDTGVCILYNTSTRLPPYSPPI